MREILLAGDTNRLVAELTFATCLWQQNPGIEGEKNGGMKQVIGIWGWYIIINIRMFFWVLKMIVYVVLIFCLPGFLYMFLFFCRGGVK